MNKKLVLAGLAAALVACSGFASAATATGTVTVSGTSVASCTISSPTVALGNIPSGNGAAATIIPTAVSVTCPTGTPWTMTSGASNNLTVGTAAATANAVRLMNAAGTSNLASGITGTGTGSAQTENLSLQVADSTFATSVTTTGAISGTVPVTLTW